MSRARRACPVGKRSHRSRGFARRTLFPSWASRQISRRVTDWRRGDSAASVPVVKPGRSPVKPGRSPDYLLARSGTKPSSVPGLRHEPGTARAGDGSRNVAGTLGRQRGKQRSGNNDPGNNDPAQFSGPQRLPPDHAPAPLVTLGEVDLHENHAGSLFSENHAGSLFRWLASLVFGLVFAGIGAVNPAAGLSGLGLWFTILFVFAIGLYLWHLVRVIKGLVVANGNRAIAQPASWWLG